MYAPNISLHRDFPAIQFRARTNRRGSHWLAEAWQGENVVASAIAGTEAKALSRLREHLMGSPHYRYDPEFPNTAPGRSPHVAA